MEKPRRFRRNYFPEPRFQRRFLLFLVAGSLLQVLATILILYYFLSQNYMYLVNFAGLDPAMTKLLHRELSVLIAVITFTFCLYLGATVVLGVLFSHRIAGVIYALKRTIKDINSGKDVLLQLRQNDEFQDLQEAFNGMVKNLKGQAGSQKAG